MRPTAQIVNVKGLISPLVRMVSEPGNILVYKIFLEKLNPYQ